MRTLAVGKIEGGRMTMYAMSENGDYVGITRKINRVEPVPAIEPVSLDIPAFMKKSNPIEKPRVKQGRQSFAEIMAEVDRILK